MVETVPGMCENRSSASPVKQTRIQAHIRAQMYTYTHTHIAYTYTSVCTHLCTHIHNTHPHLFTHTSGPLFTLRGTHIHMHIHLHLHAHIYHIHTYNIHTPSAYVCTHHTHIHVHTHLPFHMIFVALQEIHVECCKYEPTWDYVTRTYTSFLSLAQAALAFFIFLVTNRCAGTPL